MTCAAAASTTLRRRLRFTPASRSDRSASTVDRRSSCSATGTSSRPRIASAKSAAWRGALRRTPSSETGSPIDDQGDLVLARRGRRPPHLARRTPDLDRAERQREPPIGIADRDADPDVAEVEPEDAAGPLGPIRHRRGARAPGPGWPRAPPGARSARGPPAFAMSSLPPAPPPITVAASASSAGAVTPRPIAACVAAATRIAFPPPSPLPTRPPRRVGPAAGREP